MEELRRELDTLFRIVERQTDAEGVYRALHRVFMDLVMDGVDINRRRRLARTYIREYRTLRPYRGVWNYPIWTLENNEVEEIFIIRVEDD